MYNKETSQFLIDFSKKYNLINIEESLNNIKNKKVLVIGDGIIDEYHYCYPMGKSAKSPIIVHKYLSHEVFAGGAFIIANHVAELCNEVDLVTVLGSEDTRTDVIKDNLSYNVKTHVFIRNDSPTVCKKRYIEPNRNTKLFEVNYLNDGNINAKLEDEIVKYLEFELPKYDIVLVSDFGHGFITPKITKTIKTYSKMFCVNTQTNGANSGFNMITKYKSPDFVCLDEHEARLAVQDRYNDMSIVIDELSLNIDSKCLIVTLGQKGSIGIKDDEIINTPIFSTNVIDTVGAGDAFFAFTAPCYAIKLPLDLISFIGNCAGALAVQIIGNKRPVGKHELIKFIATILQ